MFKSSARAMSCRPTMPLSVPERPLKPPGVQRLQESSYRSVSGKRKRAVPLRFSLPLMSDITLKTLIKQTHRRNRDPLHNEHLFRTLCITLTSWETILKFLMKCNWNLLQTSCGWFLAFSVFLGKWTAAILTRSSRLYSWKCMLSLGLWWLTDWLSNKYIHKNISINYMLRHIINT